MLTWPQFRESLTILLASFPKLDPSEETIQVWFMLLHDLTAASLERAVVVFCQTHPEIYPGTNVVAALRDLANPDQAPMAMLAWGEVRAQMQKIGEYGQPVFSHPRIAEVVASLGWRTLCMSEDIGLERAHFLKAYEQLGKHEQVQRVLSHSADVQQLTAAVGKPA